MNKREKAEHERLTAHALEEGTRRVKDLLLAWARKDPRPPCGADADYAHAFGIMQGLALMDLCAFPARHDSLFHKLMDEVSAEADAGTRPA